MKLHRMRLVAVVFLGLAFSSFAEGIQLTSHSVVSFASVETARGVLTNRDEFVLALSPFDRSVRMKSDREVSEREFLEFVGRSALAWSPEETNRVAAALGSVRERLALWDLQLPSTVLLIKTSGNEEGNAPYTRQNAIILPEREVSGLKGGEVLVHELFHVMSRHDPELRKKLYGIIGFTRINDIQYPDDLRSLKITNPDGVQSGWAINVTNNNQRVSAVPILYSSVPRYDPKKGDKIFRYLTFRLLVVTNDGGTWKPKLVDTKPRVLFPQSAGGFVDQVGRNTPYLIHPDEILADNFVYLVNGTEKLPTPRILEEMKKALGSPVKE